LKRFLLRSAKIRRTCSVLTVRVTAVLPAAFLLLGVLAAVAAIARTPAETIRGFGDAIIFSEDGASILSAYWKCARYHILAVLLSTSWLGVLLAPALLAVRGFTLCCTSAALLLDYPEQGALLPAAVLGISNLISVPCLLLVSADAMRLSGRLAAARLGLRYGPSTGIETKHMLLGLGLMLPVAAYEQQILPKLVAWILH